jgi:hypothetical protein
VLCGFGVGLAVVAILLGLVSATCCHCSDDGGALSSAAGVTSRVLTACQCFLSLGAWGLFATPIQGFFEYWKYSALGMFFVATGTLFSGVARCSLLRIGKNAGAHAKFVALAAVIWLGSLVMGILEVCEWSATFDDMIVSVVLRGVTFLLSWWDLVYAGCLFLCYLLWMIPVFLAWMPIFAHMLSLAVWGGSCRKPPSYGYGGQRPSSQLSWC